MKKFAGKAANMASKRHARLKEETRPAAAPKPDLNLTSAILLTKLQE